MKLNKFIVAVVLTTLVSIGLSSCSKKIATTTQALKAEEVEVKKTKSQELAEAKAALRDWGEATHYRESFAKTYAEGQARASFARKLGTLVKTASDETTDGVSIYHSNAVDSSMGEDQGIISNAMATQIAEGVIKNCVVINTDTYRRTDGQYHVYVCIEYQSSLHDLANELSKSYNKAIGQQVSDEERAKLEVHNEEFRQRVDEKLAKLGGSTF